MDSQTQHGSRAWAGKLGWTLVAGAAWFVWLSAAGALAGALLRFVVSLGEHPDSDLIFFAVLYASGALYYLLVGYAGDRLIELAPLPFAAWKPGVFILAATSLASIATRSPALSRVSFSATFAAIVLPFVLAPVAVALGIWMAAAQLSGRARRVGPEATG